MLHVVVCEFDRTVQDSALLALIKDTVAIIVYVIKGHSNHISSCMLLIKGHSNHHYLQCMLPAVLTVICVHLSEITFCKIANVGLECKNI